MLGILSFSPPKPLPPFPKPVAEEAIESARDGLRQSLRRQSDLLFRKQEIEDELADLHPVIEALQQAVDKIDQIHAMLTEEDLTNG